MSKWQDSNDSFTFLFPLLAMSSLTFCVKVNCESFIPTYASRRHRARVRPEMKTTLYLVPFILFSSSKAVKRSPKINFSFKLYSIFLCGEYRNTQTVVARAAILPRHSVYFFSPSASTPDVAKWFEMRSDKNYTLETSCANWHFVLV